MLRADVVTTSSGIIVTPRPDEPNCKVQEEQPKPKLRPASGRRKAQLHVDWGSQGGALDLQLPAQLTLKATPLQNPNARSGSTALAPTQQKKQSAVDGKQQLVKVALEVNEDKSEQGSEQSEQQDDMPLRAGDGDADFQVFDTQAVEALVQEVQQRRREGEKARLLMKAMRSEYIHLLSELHGKRLPKSAMGALRLPYPYNEALKAIPAWRPPGLSWGQAGKAHKGGGAPARGSGTAKPKARKARPVYSPEDECDQGAEDGEEGNSEAPRGLREDNAKLRQEVAALRASMAQLQKDQKASQKALHAAQEAVKPSAREVAALRLQLELAQSQAAGAEQQLQAARGRAEKAEARAAVAAARAADAERGRSRWEELGSDPADVAELEIRLQKETRKRQDAEAEAANERDRLGARVARAEAAQREAEASLRGAKDDNEVLRCQIREMENMLAERHQESGKLRDQLVSMKSKLYEAERAAREAGGDGGKLARLEAASEAVMEQLQDEARSLALQRDELSRSNHALRHELATERHKAALLQAQLQLAEQTGRSKEATLMQQLVGAHDDRSACLAAAARADALLTRLSAAGVNPPSPPAGSRKEAVSSAAYLKPQRPSTPPGTAADPMARAAGTIYELRSTAAELAKAAEEASGTSDFDARILNIFSPPDSPLLRKRT